MTPRPIRSSDTEWSPFTEDGSQAETLIVEVSPELTVVFPGRITGSELMWITQHTRSDALRWLVGEEVFARLVDEYVAPVDGAVDDDTLIDLLSIVIEHTTGLPVAAASGLAMAAGHYWEAVCRTAGWDTDVGAMPARRFCALIAATLTDPETAKRTETTREFTARLLAVGNDQPVIRRKRRRRRQARSTPR